jgi:hypothetical protein
LLIANGSPYKVWLPQLCKQQKLRSLNFHGNRYEQ